MSMNVLASQVLHKLVVELAWVVGFGEVLQKETDLLAVKAGVLGD